MLVKSPVFTIAAVICLGLGIGANASIFPFLNGIVLNPLPFEGPDELIYLYETASERGNSRISVAYPDFVDWRKQNEVFSGLAAFNGDSRTLINQGDPVRLEGAEITYDLPAILGKEPILGRGFGPDDDKPGAPGVILISEGLWQSRFGSDREVLGRTITLSGEILTVVGVMPIEFRFPERSDYWLPLRRDPVEGRGSHNLGVIGRLKPGISMESAITGMDVISRRLAEAYPGTNSDLGISMESLKERFKGDEREPAQIFYWVVCFILLLACANVANLLLARSAARKQEIAVRAALGAGRFRIVRQLITESLLLAMMGGALGLLLGRAGRDLVLAGIPVDIPSYLDFSITPIVVISLILITAFCGVLFGLAPAIEAVRSDLAATLRAGSGKSSESAGRSRFRSFLVVFEITLALTVLIGACLSMKGFMLLRNVELGFDPDNILTVRVQLSGEEYEEEQRVVLFYRDLQERISAMPGVLEASLTTELPTGDTGWGMGFYVEGTEPPPPGQSAITFHSVISPGFFSTFRIPMVRGREFNDRDAIEGSLPVVIVNESFAEKYWPDGDPVGKRISYSSQLDTEAEWMEVIGVAANTHNAGYSNPVSPGIYRPHSQYGLSNMTLVLKAASDPLDLVENVRPEIWAIDPNLPLDSIQTMKQAMVEEDWDQYLFAYMFGVFSIIALILASVGVYGVVSYSVAQRSREFGIRMALGAGPGKVVRLVVRQGVILSLFGLAAGIVISLLVMKFVSSILFGVNPTDVVVYSIATITMGIVVLIASYLPARRATNVDPVDALRIE